MTRPDSAGIGDGFAIGAKVVVKDPDGYVADKARRIRNRVGVVVAFQSGGQPIVTFPKAGRRHEYHEPFRKEFLLVTTEACPYADALAESIAARGAK